MKFANKIVAASQLLSTLATVLRNLNVQRAYLKKYIAPILADSEKDKDGSLDQNDLNKITHYYGLAVPAILGEAFCALQNKKMTSRERMASTSQGAMTGLFDDFFDKQYMSDRSIEHLINEKTVPAKKSNEKLFDHFFKSALQHVPDKAQMQQSLMEVYEAQVESKKQTSDSLTEKEIQQITLQKGGTSLIFYRSAFLPTLSAKEEKLIFNLGGLMQLANDIFDVYKDREAGIKTLITEARNIKPIRGLFQQLLSENFLLAYQLSYSKKKVQRFLAILSLGIFSRAFVCLDQLEKNELSTNGIFSVHLYSRKQLICDMDNVSNLIRSARFHLILMK